MIFHFSIDADEPERVAKALAWIWCCEAYPFPPVGVGSWIVIADDGRASAIEVYPRGIVLTPGRGAEPVQARAVPAPANSPMHFAVATQLSEAEVCALGANEGWRTVRQSRGGRFDVIELWIENRIMIEVLTPQMQVQYVSASSPALWRQTMEAKRAA